MNRLDVFETYIRRSSSSSRAGSVAFGQSFLLDVTGNGGQKLEESRTSWTSMMERVQSADLGTKFR